MSQYPSLPKGSYNPGWNDPPKFEYSPGTLPTASSKPKLNLNKRIAFPMQTDSMQSAALSGGITKVPTSASGLPLPFARVSGPISIPPEAEIVKSDPIQQPPLSSPPKMVPPPTPLIPTSNDTPSILTPNTAIQNTIDELKPDFDVASPEMLEFIQKTFNDIVKQLQGDIPKMEIIQKRLDILIDMWKNENISDNIKDKLIRIAKALEQNKCNQANELHRSLVIDQGQVCFQWGSALRQLILIKEQSIQHPTMTNNDVPSKDVFSGYLIPNVNATGTSESSSSIAEQGNVNIKSPGRVQHL